MKKAHPLKLYKTLKVQINRYFRRMESFNKEDRLFAVKLTEELFIDKIDFDDYLMQFPDDDGDEVLIELYNIIEQEEPATAFGGGSKLKQHSSMNRISELLNILRR